MPARHRQEKLSKSRLDFSDVLVASSRHADQLLPVAAFSLYIYELKTSGGEISLGNRWCRFRDDARDGTLETLPTFVSRLPDRPDVHFAPIFRNVQHLP